MSCSRTKTKTRTKKIGSRSRISTVANSTNLRDRTSDRRSNLDQLRSKSTSTAGDDLLLSRHELAGVDKIPDLPGTEKTLEIDDLLSSQPPEEHTELKEAFFPTGNARFEKTKLAFLTSLSFPFCPCLREQRCRRR